MAFDSYSITIKNMSDIPRRFLLFQDMRAPANGPSNEAFSNVYQRSAKIESGDDSRVDFVARAECFAIYGRSSDNSDGTVRVYTSSSLPVKLGPSGSHLVVSTQDGRGKDPVWDRAAMAGRKSHVRDGFTIETDSSFRYPSNRNIYVGCGAGDPRDPKSVIPVQTYIAESGAIRHLFPRAKYYVCFGEHQPGMVVNRDSLGNVLQVDFTDCSIPAATFTLTSSGTYEPDESVVKNGVQWSFGRVSGA